MNVTVGWPRKVFRRLNLRWLRGTGVARAGAIAARPAVRVDRTPTSFSLRKEWKTSMARRESLVGSSVLQISGGDPALADVLVRFRAET